MGEYFLFTLAAQITTLPLILSVFQQASPAALLPGDGSDPLNPLEWLAALHLQVVLLSVAAGDRQGLPDAEMLEAVQGYNLLRTDRDG